MDTRTVRVDHELFRSVSLLFYPEGAVGVLNFICTEYIWWGCYRQDLRHQLIDYIVLNFEQCRNLQHLHFQDDMVELIILLFTTTYFSSRPLSTSLNW